jgi:hypothetical protein
MSTLTAVTDRWLRVVHVRDRGAVAMGYTHIEKLPLFRTHSAVSTHPPTSPSLLLWTRCNSYRSFDHYGAVVEYFHRPTPCRRLFAIRCRCERAFQAAYHADTLRRSHITIDLVHDHTRSEASPTMLGRTQHLISDIISQPSRPRQTSNKLAVLR